MSIWIKNKVLFKRNWKNDLFSIKLKNNIFSFFSGQYTKLAIKNNNKYIFRMYSFVNTFLEENLEFYLLRIKNGFLSNILYSLNIGDYIYISKYSYGNFIVNNLPNIDNLWMISTSTGISPYLSILQDNINLIKSKFKKVILINAIKYCSDYNYCNKILNLQKKYGNNYLYLITIVSREKNTLNSTFKFSGRITNLLLNDVLQKFLCINISKNKDHFMVCGNPNMIKSVCNILHQKYNFNLRNKNITIERYW